MKKQLLSEDVRRLLKGEDTTIGSFSFGMLTPTNYLDFFEPFQEFLVASAEEVLKQGKYAAWYLKESTANHRMIILDSQPELTLDKLEQAAVGIAVAAVIGPIYTQDMERSINETIKMSEDFGPDIGVLGVCYGQSIDDGIRSFRKYLDSEIKMIGFSNHFGNRLELIRELHDLHLLEARDNYILGGVTDLEELQRISALGDWSWLLYSNAPIGISLQHRDILEFVHNVPEWSLSKLGKDFNLSEEDLYLVTANLVKFRTLLPQTDDDSEEDD